jgi:hypothetical protein
MHAFGANSLLGAQKMTQCGVRCFALVVFFVQSQRTAQKTADEKAAFDQC